MYKYIIKLHPKIKLILVFRSLKISIVVIFTFYFLINIVPELPEIETIVEGAKQKLTGKKIKSVEIRVPKIVGGDIKNFNLLTIGSSLKSVRRRAKIIIIDLSNGYSILIHLKLTGQLVYEKKIRISDFGFRISRRRRAGGHPARVYDQPLPHNYTHVIITFTDGSHLYFNDIRKFGYLKLVKTDEVEERPEIKNLGPEPLNNWKYQDFQTRLNRRPRSNIKQTLMDQKFVSGIGNIYANEILFHAKVRPLHKVSGLSENQKKQIFKSIKFILKKGIELGGSSENTYVNLEGEKGNFMEYAKVYRKKKCKACGGEIKRIVIGGRGTFCCLKCQK